MDVWMRVNQMRFRWTDRHCIWLHEAKGNEAWQIKLLKGSLLIFKPCFFPDKLLVWPPCCIVLTSDVHSESSLNPAFKWTVFARLQSRSLVISEHLPLISSFFAESTCLLLCCFALACDTRVWIFFWCGILIVTFRLAESAGLLAAQNSFSTDMWNETEGELDEVDWWRLD